MSGFIKINKLLIVGLSSILLFSCGNEQSSLFNVENYLIFGEKYLSEGTVIDANMFEISHDVVIQTGSVGNTLFFSISYLNSQNLRVTFE